MFSLKYKTESLMNFQQEKCSEISYMICTRTFVLNDQDFSLKKIITKIFFLIITFIALGNISIQLKY